MSILSEATLREKLAQLNTTQHVIETTSTWCCFFPKEARKIALIWEDAFSKADQPKRLAMVYLANDVLQNSRKKGPEFVTEFFKVLPRALRHMLSKADDKTAAAVNKVIRIWEERRVFGSGTKSFKQVMEEAETPSRRNSGGALPPVPSPATAAGAANGGLPAHSAVPHSLEPLVQALQQVHQAALRSAQLSAAGTAAAAAAQSGSAAEVASSQAALQQLVGALQQERDARGAATAALQGLLRSQEEASARLAGQLGSLSRQLVELEGRRRQLEAAGAAGAEVPAAPAAAVGPAQLADLMHFMQPPPQQPQQPPAPQPMYSLAASGAAAMPAAVLHQPVAPLPPAQQQQQAQQQQEAGGYQPPAPRPDAGAPDEMDLSEDTLVPPLAPAHAPAPMQRHPSLQQPPPQQQQPVLLAPALQMPQQQMPPPAQQQAPLQHIAGQPGPAPPAPLQPAPLQPAVAAPAAAQQPAAGASDAGLEAAALAAQLTSNAQSAQALLEVLLGLPKAGDGAQPGPPNPAAQQAQQHSQQEQEQEQGEAEDLYDPEDPFGE